MAEANKERTFMVKPDGVQRGLVGVILSRFEQKGFQLVDLKQLIPCQDLLKKYYADLSTKPFFPGFTSYMSTGPVVAIVWQGLNVVKTGVVMLCETNPQDSKPGTIHDAFSIQIADHGLDSVESTKKEIALWFQAGELNNWKPNAYE